ncbi:MAG: sulfotransferase domain-containing protein [Pseudomonadota bacterium]
MKRFIGTYHKTGTVLIDGIALKLIAGDVIKTWRSESDEEPETWDLCTAPHAHKHYEEMAEDRPDRRYVVVVRDPRDVIVSGAYYHMTSNEAWLHEPRPHLNGDTYHDRINAEIDMQARFGFELKHAGGSTIRSMEALPEEKKNVLRLHFEDLVTDESLLPFSQMFDFLELPSEMKDTWMKICWQVSLFGGTANKRSKHVRSGQPGQWKTELSHEVLSLYETHLGAPHRTLGYPDDGWMPSAGRG